MSLLNTSIEAGAKIIRVITSLKPQDVFLIGFIALLVLSLGVLTGYIPSPLLKMAEQHSVIIQNGKDNAQASEKLIQIAELQLYLAREICLQGAEASNDRARCDRQSIKDIILSSTDEYVSTYSALKP